MFEMNQTSTFVWTNETMEDDQLDLFLIEVPVTIVQIVFVILGMILKAMIVYFEHFGRDTQKRSLLNRVSWHLKWLLYQVMNTGFL